MSCYSLGVYYIMFNPIELFHKLTVCTPIISLFEVGLWREQKERAYIICDKNTTKMIHQDWTLYSKKFFKNDFFLTFTSFYYYLKSTKHVASINGYILSFMCLWHTLYIWNIVKIGSLFIFKNTPEWQNVKFW